MARRVLEWIGIFKGQLFFTHMKINIRLVSNLLISTKISCHNNSDLKVCSLPLGQRAKWACIQWSVAEMQQSEPSLQYSQEAKWPLDLNLELWIWCIWEWHLYKGEMHRAYTNNFHTIVAVLLSVSCESNSKMPQCYQTLIWHLPQVKSFILRCWLY